MTDMDITPLQAQVTQQPLGARPGLTEFLPMLLQSAFLYKKNACMHFMIVRHWLCTTHP